MEFIVQLGSYLLPFLGVLTVLVFVHELGHYSVARYNGVKIDVFSIGFGPELLGWNDRAGTRWKISLLPLGGYVKFYGDADAASTPDLQTLGQMTDEGKSQSLFHKTVWQRIAVSAAGPLANYLFAIVVLTSLFVAVGYRTTEPVIVDVLPQSVAEAAGLQKGDRVLKVQGQEVRRFEDITAITQENPEKPLTLEIDRQGRIFSVPITPRLSVMQDRFGYTHKVGVLGIKSGAVSFQEKGFFSSIGFATKDVFVISYQTLRAVGEMIMGTRSADGMGGPLRIAQMSKEVSDLGLIALLWFTALLSINLGLINLFPIPMLDGGHLLLYFIEILKGKPLSEKAQEWAFRGGFFIVLALVFFTTWNDLNQFHFFHWIQKIFS